MTTKPYTAHVMGFPVAPRIDLSGDSLREIHQRLAELHANFEIEDSCISVYRDGVGVGYASATSWGTPEGPRNEPPPPHESPQPIESTTQRYNRLYDAAVDARKALTEISNQYRDGMRAASRQEVAARATELAVEDWPRLRADIILRGARLPDGPTVYRASESPYGGFVGSCEVPYISLAMESLEPEFERRAARASEEFDACRRELEEALTPDQDASG